jgi:hypothetical protein
MSIQFHPPRQVGMGPGHTPCIEVVDIILLRPRRVSQSKYLLDLRSLSCDWRGWLWPHCHLSASPTVRRFGTIELGSGRWGLFKHSNERTLLPLEQGLAACYHVGWTVQLTTGPISMIWNNRSIVRLFALVLPCFIAHQLAAAADICPHRDGQPLRYVDVFDGPPEEMATLVPDKDEERFGYWLLAYVYDAGRSVTIRCKYADGEASDVKVPNKVTKCDYKIDQKKVLTISCQ